MYSAVADRPVLNTLTGVMEGEFKPEGRRGRITDSEVVLEPLAKDRSFRRLRITMISINPVESCKTLTLGILG